MTIMTRLRSRSMDVRRGLRGDMPTAAATPLCTAFSGDAAEDVSNKRDKALSFQTLSSAVRRTRGLHAQPDTFVPARGGPPRLALMPSAQRRRKPIVLINAIGKMNG